eukprot:jgi/Botrbrau1/18790/Bobra.0386s0105.1
MNIMEQVNMLSGRKGSAPPSLLSGPQRRRVPKNAAISCHSQRLRTLENNATEFVGRAFPNLSSSSRCYATSSPAPLHVAQGVSSVVPDESCPRPRNIQAADMEEILKESGACGVGFIANLKNNRSHNIVEQALTGLGCMEHRGGCSADDDSGDGAGVMTHVPWALIKEDIPDVDEDTSGVGMVFLPNDDKLEAASRQIVEDVVAAEGRCRVVGWRKVPVDHEIVGRLARMTEPRIWQVVISHNEGVTGAELERELFLLRKLMENEKARRISAEPTSAPTSGPSAADFYICSLSNKTIVYKGMLKSVALGSFYKDLKNPLYTTAMALYHRRFSTNTTPKWPLAQPMRVLGHNGEINTLQGNLNWVASREHSLSNPIWHGRESELLPLCNASESDSANLDHVAELMFHTDIDPQEAIMVLVPEAYRNHPELNKTYPEVEFFYEYYEGLQEGWDGPALIVFSDGDKVGARLDRNGLRPARFWLTDDGMVYVASEVGVFGDVISNAGKVTAKGRLGPGQMVCVDLLEGTWKTNTEIAIDIASKHPYKEWLSAMPKLKSLGASNYLEKPIMSPSELMRFQASMGIGLEDVGMIMEEMVLKGAEPIFCMGDDAPLAVLSSRPHLLYDYFKQRFAQVTNPPIDPIREGLVMSLEMRLGKRGNLLQPGPDAYHQVLLDSPFLIEEELQAIQTVTGLAFRTFSLYFDLQGPDSLKKAVDKLCADVEAAVSSNCEVVILSDKPNGAPSANRPPIPALLAVGAVHHHLIRRGLRTETSLVVETAQCFSTHHAAMLIGYGAHAICPYLLLDSARSWRTSTRVENQIKSGKLGDITAQRAQQNAKYALDSGLLKILSKMGISLLSCYHGAQIFEAYGLGPEVIDTSFKGTVSRVGGLSLADLQREVENFWAKGFANDIKKLEDYGFISVKPRGEVHVNNQQLAKQLHKAIGLGTRPVEDGAYQEYLDMIYQGPPTVLRDCLEIVPAGSPVSLDEVESVASICTRFCTGGMSLGAISRETHETIAIAMNRIGGKSNSGEGGEDPERWKPLTDVSANGLSQQFDHLKGLQQGDIATSRIKQVASGRFGVTPEFLVNADQLEIKIAQGAKPGEGGQLPGQKVVEYIANLRRSKPGVPLISPPPHHDIYSIEDLAQLIFDLHMVSQEAKVSVKLVAQAGIGTVASGVAKAGADIIQVSGHDGGTGASPVSSIKHAGGPIEMGLAEVHQSLTTNELRERVVLRVDGGMRTGRDILMMAALGADEFGFGTIAMIATGCVMARVCHTNNCPVGVASQRETLRARFPGVPADLVNFFTYVAMEVRSELARLGLRSLDELVGRADLLRPKKDVSITKTAGLDLSFITRYAGEVRKSSERISQAVQSVGPVLDDDILGLPEIQKALESGGDANIEMEIFNVDRSSLGRLGGVIAKQFGDKGFPGSININLKGSAGQSFGCFLVKGVNVTLIGEANDYVGKGMADGQIVIKPPAESKFKTEEASIVGNTCFYGATGGSVFINGRGGERFAVRYSADATAVVEGAGDHCCEYMTGGVVVCLGHAGRNAGAGMTGGLAYFYDEDGDFPTRVNRGVVTVQRVRTKAGEAQLKGLIEKHLELTGSTRAKAILAKWEEALPLFWQLVPPSEKQTPEATDLLSSTEEPVAVDGKAPTVAPNGQKVPANGKNADVPAAA